MAGSFKDNAPQPGEPRLVYDVSDVSVDVLETAPLQIRITANGHARTGGWSEHQLVLDEDASVGIHLVYRFVAVPPDGMATQAITPITASVDYGPWLDRAGREIEVVAETNSVMITYPTSGQE